MNVLKISGYLQAYRFSLVRSQARSQIALIFLDEGYSADIELHQNTTQEQILNLNACQVGTTELKVRSS
ncbi:MAG: hypothetical protein M3O33_00860 [Cyanobacteriota bacterium]|nr:hypothetical protein [Cyanobacteriota bacterium]